MDYNFDYNENNFSAWGAPAKKESEEIEEEEEYIPVTRTGKINQILDEYLDRKANLDKIKGMKGAERIEEIYQKILDNLGNKLNEIK
ncbi:MAG: hypothetical protein P8P37_01700 [Candidatus Marinimicrobia bacterium]|nr:hypothetical protein [Candidatus Neomarinimicrobiota bacterium]